MLHTVTPVQMQKMFFFVNSHNYTAGSIITDRVSLLITLFVKAIQNNYEIHLAYVIPCLTAVDLGLTNTSLQEELQRALPRTLATAEVPWRTALF